MSVGLSCDDGGNVVFESMGANSDEAGAAVASVSVSSDDGGGSRVISESGKVHTVATAEDNKLEFSLS